MIIQRSKRRHLTERPDGFVLNKNHPLAGSLVFAGLGGMGFGTGRYHDSSMFGNHGTLVGFTDANNKPENMWRNYIGRSILSFPTTTTQKRVVTNCKRATSPTGTFVWWQYNLVAYNAGNRLSMWFGTGGTDPSIQVFNVSGTWYVGHMGGTDWRLRVAANASNCPTKVWTAYAMTWQPGITQFFCNGVRIGIKSDATNTYNPTDGFGITYPGNRYDPNSDFADVIFASNVLPSGVIVSLADPSNVMLNIGGQSLIFPPKRRIFKSVSILEKFKNLAFSDLNGDIDNTTTIITVSNGSSFPSDNFRILIDNEIIFVGIRNENTFSECIRNYEESGNTTHINSTRVKHIVTVSGMKEFVFQNCPRNVFFEINGNFVVQTLTPLINAVQITRPGIISSGTGVALTAPTISSTVFSICKNVKTYGNGENEVASFSVATSGDVTTTLLPSISLVPNDYLTIFCTQVGSTPGADGNFTLTIV